MKKINLSASLLCSLSGTAVVLPLLSSCSAQKKAEVKPYNIVYIMTDDHTSQMMSCYDDRYASTPNLDRIADEGVRFTNSFVANSLSGPSRACMLTGKHSHANGYTDNTFCAPFDGSQQTFPKLLQGAGYETAVVGKWHLGSLPTGFDYWEVVPGQGDYYNPLFIRQSGDTTLCEGYLTNIITDKSIEWLEHGRDTTKPFCLLVHHKAQHRNWMADTCHLALYEERDFPLPETFFDDYEGRPAAAAQEMSIASDHHELRAPVERVAQDELPERDAGRGGEAPVGARHRMVDGLRRGERVEPRERAVVHQGGQVVVYQLGGRVEHPLVDAVGDGFEQPLVDGAAEPPCDCVGRLDHPLRGVVRGRVVGREHDDDFVFDAQAAENGGRPAPLAVVGQERGDVLGEAQPCGEPPHDQRAEREQRPEQRPPAVQQVVERCEEPIHDRVFVS